MFGLVYSPWEQVTTSHHGSQVSLSLLLTGTGPFLSIFAVPNSAVLWTTSNLTFTPIRFTYSLKLTNTAPRAPITTDTTMTFRMRQTFAISSFNSEVKKEHSKVVSIKSGKWLTCIDSKLCYIVGQKKSKGIRYALSSTIFKFL